MENVPQFKANALDRLVAAGKIREKDRELVIFIVRTIVHPPERSDDTLPLSNEIARNLPTFVA